MWTPDTPLPENCAGKTTLFNLLTGFLAPTAGTILYRGEDITGNAPEQIGHHCEAPDLGCDRLGRFNLAVQDGHVRHGLGECDRDRPADP